MLIAVAADAHGMCTRMDALLRALPDVAAFCFLGDMDRDAAYLQYALAESRPRALFLAVAGNNDFGSPLPGTIEWTFEKTRAILTHGHLFRVKLTRAALASYAASRDCRLALFGHTHRPLDEWVDGVRLVNPGALADGRWALVETGARGDAPDVRLMGDR